MNRKPLTPKQQKLFHFICGVLVCLGFLILFVGDVIVDKEKFGESIKTFGILITISPIIPYRIFWSRIISKEKQDRKDFINKILYIKRMPCDFSKLLKSTTKNGFLRCRDEQSDCGIEQYYKRKVFYSSDEMILIKSVSLLNEIEKFTDIFIAEEISTKGYYEKPYKKNGSLCMAILVIETVNESLEKEFLEISKKFIEDAIEKEDETFSFDENYTSPTPLVFVPIIFDKEKNELVYAYTNIINKVDNKKYIAHDRIGYYRKGIKIIKKLARK